MAVTKWTNRSTTYESNVSGGNALELWTALDEIAMRAGGLVNVTWSIEDDVVVLTREGHTESFDGWE